MEFTNVLPGVKLVKQDEGIPFDTIDDIIKG